MHGDISIPTERLANFPDHLRVLRSAIELLSADDRVLGIYLTGSFSAGLPDRYSDLDLNILVSEIDRELIIRDHRDLQSKVGQIATWFPATHLGNPNQIIVFYKGESDPVHVDYEYKIESDLKPKSKGAKVVLVYDPLGRLASWKALCLEQKEVLTPTLEKLQYFEDRFWGWCLYTHGKIMRGELYEARDAIEYLRSNVLVRLIYYQLGLENEGNRRLEKKFSIDMLKDLESTVSIGHSQQEYLRVIRRLAELYPKCFSRAVGNLEGVREADRGYFSSILGE